MSIEARQVLREHIPDQASVERAVVARGIEHNQVQASISWRFTTPDERIKLKRLYPSFES